MHRSLIVGAVVAAAGSANAGWIAINLQFSASGSVARGNHGTQQVGSRTQSSPAIHTRATIWSGTPMSGVDLHAALPPSHSTNALATDGVQQVGTHSTSPTSTRAVVWNGTAASMTSLHPTIGPLYSQSQATDVHAGRQVGHAQTPTGVNHAALWSSTATSFVNLHTSAAPLGAQQSVAAAIEGKSIVGTITVAGGLTRAAHWREIALGNFVSLSLHHPGLGTSTMATGVTVEQQVVGIASGPFGTRGVVWSDPMNPASGVLLNALGATATSVADVDGGFQVGNATIGGKVRAWLWNGPSFLTQVDLHALLPAGFYASSEARSVWTDGSTIRVAGFARTHFGRDEAMLWEFTDNVIPLPTAAGMSLAGVGLIAARRRRA